MYELYTEIDSEVMLRRIVKSFAVIPSYRTAQGWILREDSSHG